jgi:hypothetical protein
VKQSDKNPSCEDFHAQLLELIGSGMKIGDHPHLQRCDLCRALITDLEAIAQAARELLPIEDPPDALWSNIELALGNDRAAESAPGANAQ